MDFTSSYENFSTTTTAIFSDHLKPDDFFIYFEDLFTITNRLSANLGLHYSIFSINKKSYQSPQPRVALRYLLNKTSSIKISYASMQQHIHLLTNSSFGLPNDMWVPATELVSPQLAQQFVCGYHKSINDNLYELSIEAYHKQMDNLITFSEGSNIISTNFSSWEDKIEMNGKGVSRNRVFKKNKGHLTGWLGYTAKNY